MRLQRSLLSDRLPEIEGVELIGRYNAGRRRTRDRRRLVRRRAPVGRHRARHGRRRRGPRRHRGRADGPAAQRLPRARLRAHLARRPCCGACCRHVDEDEMATALCLTLDPYTQELTYASAGHPPSLLVDGDAARRLAPRARAARRRSATCSPRRSARPTVELPAGAHARRLHRRPRRAPRLEHRHRHRPAGVRARMRPRRSAPSRSPTGSSRRSRRASARPTTSRS